MRGEYSLSDIAAATGNSGNNGNNGFGDGNGAWWIIILIVLLGWGRNGFGGNQGGNDGGQGASYYYGGGFGSPNIYGKLDGISYGIADSTFALNNSITSGFAGVQQTLCQGFAGLNTAIAQSGFNTERGLWTLSSQFADCCCDIKSRIADCCCQTQRSIDHVNYNMAQNTCAITNSINNSTRDILENNNCNTRAILDFLTKDKIDTLQAENQALRFQASQTAQNAFITANQDAQTAELIRRLGADCPVPAYVVNSPTPINFPTNCCGNFVGYGYNNNNGCGCGCNNY